MIDGTILDRCYFCRESYGSCRCRWYSWDGFACKDFWITEPNVDETGFRFVDPYKYYGPAYATWAAGIGTRRDHWRSAGAACTDDGTGTCSGCGVAMVQCYRCSGVGYHADLCHEVES